MNIIETLKGLQNLIITLENSLRDTKEELEEERTQHKDTKAELEEERTQHKDTKAEMEEERIQHKDTAEARDEFIQRLQAQGKQLEDALAFANNRREQLLASNNRKKEQIEGLLIEKIKVEEELENLQEQVKNQKRLSKTANDTNENLQGKINVTFISLRPISK